MAFLFSGLSGPSLGQGGPASVTTDIVRTEAVAETVSVFGQVVSGRQSDVATRVMGVVESAPLRIGDKVNAGDVVFTLDTERLKIELEQAQAEIAIAEAGLVVAEARAGRLRKALERTQTLVDNATVSQAQLDDRSGEYAEALGNLQQAGARITAAKAGLRAAEYNVANSTVRAPFEGTVLEVTAEIGEFVAAGHVVVKLLDHSALEVEANVPSRYIGALQFDQIVMARTDADRALELELRAILPTEFSSTRTRPVRFHLANQAGDIAVGQSVTLDVPVSRPQDVVVVAKDAVTQAAGGWQVFLHRDGKAVSRPVDIGRSIGGAFEVLGGLAVGDEVVVRGNERLRSGQDIVPMPASGREDSAASAEPGASATSGG